jgi:hypothetical protein
MRRLSITECKRPIMCYLAYETRASPRGMSRLVTANNRVGGRRACILSTAAKDTHPMTRCCIPKTARRPTNHLVPYTKAAHPSYRRDVEAVITERLGGSHADGILGQAGREHRIAARGTRVAGRREDHHVRVRVDELVEFGLSGPRGVRNGIRRPLLWSTCEAMRAGFGGPV